MKNNKPTLTLFCGLPGSGKTRIAKQLEQSAGAVRLCTDDWLTDIHADLFDVAYVAPVIGIPPSAFYAVLSIFHSGMCVVALEIFGADSDYIQNN